MHENRENRTPGSFSALLQRVLLSEFFPYKNLIHYIKYSFYSQAGTAGRKGDMYEKCLTDG